MCRVLLVDDDEPLVRALARTLRLAGHEVEACTSAEAALQQLSAAPFDAIISDVEMPGMDGVALLRHCRQQHPRLRRVLMSARAASAAAEAEPYRELRKPFPAELMEEALSGL